MNNSPFETKNKKCQMGQHIPVAAIKKSGRLHSVFCQECGVPMTKEQHQMYFKYYNGRMLKLYGREWKQIKEIGA